MALRHCSNSSATPILQSVVIYNQMLEHANTSSTAGAVLHLARIEAEGNIQARSNRRSMRFRASSRLRPIYSFAIGAVVLASLTGCGNTYRPVVTAINPVGPASQPQRYAVAISDPG